jgi:AmmeMemoRadiSam system protein B
MVRKPVVQGQFYPGTKEALAREVSGLIDRDAAKEDAIGAVSPHAGYMYSGSVAGKTLSAMRPRSSYVIIGPNHTGMGEAFSLCMAETWTTPMGNVSLDKRLAEAILKGSRYVKPDELAHAAEHSVEVQIPILQALQKEFKIVPMIVSYAGVDIYRDIGRAIAGSVKRLRMEGDVAIIASSDMTHYESAEAAKRKDRLAIEAVLALDEGRLVETVERHGISMCGYAPAAIMLAASKGLGAKSGRLIEYRTSGDVTGDFSSVVGYAGVLIK